LKTRELKKIEKEAVREGKWPVFVIEFHENIRSEEYVVLRRVDFDALFEGEA